MPIKSRVDMTFDRADELYHEAVEALYAARPQDVYALTLRVEALQVIRDRARFQERRALERLYQAG